MPDTSSKSATSSERVTTRSASQQSLLTVVDLTVETSHISDHSLAEAKTYERTPEEVAFERHGFAQPPKLFRSVALHAKGSDPAMCLDLLDDMYGFYMHHEVDFFF